jgi:molybdopterin synthase sulfur carrier subunit
MPTVLIPTPLRRLTTNQAKVDVAGDTVDALLHNLDAAYPGIGERLLDVDGKIKRFINVFVNEDEIRTLQGAETPVAPGDRVSIVPAMAGGV